MVTHNFGDFQNLVYADAVKGKTSRYPFDFQSIQRKASEALPDWVYRYVSDADGDGRTERANIEEYSRYGIVPRMMVSPPERDLSIDLFDKHLPSQIFSTRSASLGCAHRTFRAMWPPRRHQRQPVCRSRCPRSPRPRWRTSSSMPVTHRTSISSICPRIASWRQV